MNDIAFVFYSLLVSFPRHEIKTPSESDFGQLCNPEMKQYDEVTDL